MRNDGCLPAVVFLVAIYLVIQMITTYYIVVLVIIAMVIAYFLFRYWRKKKRALAQQQLEKWPLDHLEILEQAISPQLDLVKKYQDQLINDPYYAKGLPDENFTMLNNLEERDSYFQVLNINLCNKFNELVIPHYPFLKPVENEAELHEALEYILYRAKVQLYDLDLSDPQSSTVKAMNEILHRNGIDYFFAKDVLNWLEPHYQHKIARMFRDIHSEMQIIRKGIQGEKKVMEELELYRDIWTTLYNVRIETGGLSVESDAIIVSKKGIFSIEAKNFGSTGKYHIRITKDGQWQKVFANGQFEVMHDVASQVNRHIGIKQRFINEKLKESEADSQYLFIESIIVIANDQVTMTNESDQVIIRASQIYNYIKNKSDSMDQDQMELVTSLFKNNMLEPKRYSHHDFVASFEAWLRLATPVLLFGSKLGNAIAAYSLALGDHSSHNSSLLVSSIDEASYCRNYATAGMVGEFYTQ